MSRYKCKICGYEVHTKKDLAKHIRKKHVNANYKKKQGHSILGFAGGLISGYALVISLEYILGYLIAGMIYAVIFIWVLNKGRDKKDRTLKWLGIGGLGLLLGLFINYIIWKGEGRSNVIKYSLSFVAWLIIIMIFVIISYAKI